MRREIQSLKDKESKQKATKKKGAVNQGHDLVIDDEFLLPYNYGFDDIIKEKSEEIDSQKEVNSKVMDELVLKLGYMDYRDALACNKYILEAKRSQDYHQLARSRVLQTAMGRLARTRRENLEREAHKQAASQAQPGTEEYQRLNEDFKLTTMMNEDAEVAE